MSTRFPKFQSLITSFRTIATNWRTIVMFVIFGLGLAFLSDFVVNWSTRKGDVTGLATVSNYLQGFSRYVGANAAAALLGIVAWPTINKFGNSRFQEGWDSLGLQGQTIVYIALMATEGICAAICFSV